MAAAPSPDRSIVLRRLGIIKDPDETTSLQDSRAPRERKRSGLEYFESEAPTQLSSRRELPLREPSPREEPLREQLLREPLPREVPLREQLLREEPLDAIRRELAARTNVVAPRSPLVAVLVVLLVSGVALVAAIGAIDRLFDADTAPAQVEAPAVTTDPRAVTANDVTAPRSNETSSGIAVVATPVPTASRANDVRGEEVAPSQSGSASDETVGLAADARPVGPADGLATLPRAIAPAISPDAPPSSTPAETVIDQTIYSQQDRDVVPPRTSEQLPGPTISEWSTRTNAMEVIVSQTGAVERVRLLTPPQRMPDMLVLGRAKVWKFTPAMKAGKPVRYRLLLTWEVNP